MANFSRDRGDTRNYSGELDRAKSAGHRASTADRRGRAPAKVKLDEHRAQIREVGHGDKCLTSGWSSGRLGAVSSELDGRECRRGSPVASGGEGRARERVRVCEMRRGASAGHWQGSKKGARRVGGASWPRNLATCVSAHTLVHGGREEGGSDRVGPRRRERKKGRSGQRLDDW